MERRISSSASISSKSRHLPEDEEKEEDKEKEADAQEKNRRSIMKLQCMNSTKIIVLCILCLQNSMFTILRRYSQGVLKEVYSKVRD